MSGNFMSKVNRPVDGYLSCIADVGTEKERVIFSDEKNLVLNKGSEILRNVMFGDASQITKMVFGDMNLDPQVDDIVNVDPPQLTDTQLTNKLFEKPLALTKTTYGGHPALRCESTIAANEFNGTGEQLITEFGLANAAEELFSRKTRSAIFKNAESSLTFIWYLVFN